MAFAQLKGISLAFGARDILSDINFNLASGERIALSGANGSGKSTLMKIMAGSMKPDRGEVVRQKDARIAYLPQSGISYADSTLQEEAEQAFGELHSAAAEMESIEHEMQHLREHGPKTDRLLERYQELQELIQRSGYYTRQASIDRVLTGLGFERDDRAKECAQFSGGWQMRIALAKVLLRNPDIMLLDEPTNYLDLEARNWLEEYLSGYSGGLLVVSHDRYFLDVLVQGVAEIWNGRLKRYRGNYTEYEKRRGEELESLLEAYRKQQEEIAKLEEFISRFRSNASKAQLVQSRIKTLEKIEPIEIPEGMKRIRFSFPQPPHSGREALTLSGIGKSYGDHRVLQDVDLEVRRGEKLVIAGKNGAGKSTLMRIISGKDADFDGELRYGSGIRLGYFSQDAGDRLPAERTVIQEIEEAAPTSMVPRVRDLLGAFLFRGDDVYKSVGVLSGGERSRLALLKLLLSPANLLVLDEPTNHLDMTSKDVLLDALREYNGTVLFVSHDRGFIESLATRVLELSPGARYTLFPGDYRYYLWKKEQEAAAGSAASPDSGSGSGYGSGNTPSIAVGDGGPSAAASGASTAALSREEQKRYEREMRRLQREEEDLVGRMEKLSAEHEEIQHRMALPENYTDGERMKELKTSLERNESEQHRLASRWETVTAEMERLIEHSAR